ncbi:MAG: LEA type 2 family protein [Polyangiaceae bacterium]|nr:LEA type 2 family protein [Polyangiaceae bacterium]
MRIAFCAALLVAACMGGCTPSVQLKSAVLQGATLQGPRFDAVLAFDNPNAFDLQVRAVRANVRVGAATIPVIYEPNVWIPANQTVNISVPVTVPWTAVPTLAGQVVTASSVAYTIAGNADVTASRALQIDSDAYRFNEEGTLPRSIFLQTGGGLPLTLGVGAPARR